jgi:hypothetical protein
MEHGFRPLKAGKMHPNALKPLPSGAARQGGAEPPLPRSASAPQVYVVMLFFSFIHVALRSQHCSHPRGVLGANPCSCGTYCFIEHYRGENGRKFDVEKQTNKFGVKLTALNKNVAQKCTRFRIQKAKRKQTEKRHSN